jgi:hypothetical protein
MPWVTANAYRDRPSEQIPDRDQALPGSLASACAASVIRAEQPACIGIEHALP